MPDMDGVEEQTGGAPEDAPPVRRRKARKPWRWLRRLFSLLVLLVIGACAAGYWAYHLYHGPGPLAEGRNIVVPRGALSAMGASLQEAGLIGDPRVFLVAVTLTQKEGPLRAGEFAFPARASLRQVLTVLRTARTVQRRLTIPEGLTAVQINDLLMQADGLSGAGNAQPEGSVLPETYAFEYDTRRGELLTRARTAMDRALAEVWAARAADLPLASPRELLILASIVERETGKPEERGMVAGVFVNRLRRNMPLQTDPTVIYAVSQGRGVLDRGLTRVDLDVDSPFNTYRYRGLPPGPIASPGLASLRAAANPATTDALYFVADGTGGHVFAATLEEHNRNVARWRQLERNGQ